MAVAEIKATKIGVWNAAETLGDATSVSTDGGYMTWDESDDKLVLLLEAAALATVTVQAGGGIQGVNDLSVSVPAGGSVLLALESGRFKQVSGSNKGRLVLDTTAAVSVTPIVMP